MKKTIAFTLLFLLVASVAGEPPIIPCDTDTDCEIKNFWVCGGPYARPCDNWEN
jgi:hypothetical protein